MNHPIAANHRDVQTLEFIKAYVKQLGYAPSVLDIAVGLDIVPSAVGKRLQRLQAIGWITRQPRKVRSIVVVKDAA